MLVLTRMPGQSIIIDNDIVVRILKIKGNQIKIGVSAPEHTSIHREEVWWRIKNEAENNKHSARYAEEIFNPNNPEGKPFYINDETVVYVNNETLDESSDDEELLGLETIIEEDSEYDSSYNDADDTHD